MFTLFKLHSLQIFRAVGYRLLSSTCIICRLPAKQARDLCCRCEADLPLNNSACYQCALPITGAASQMRCGHCLQKPPAFERTIAPYHYQDAITRLIYDLKFNQQLANANVLGQICATKIKQHYQKQILPEIIIPIPLHRRRLRQRGFNQALEISKPVSRLLNIPIDKFSCQRIIDTVPQTRLTAKLRRKNLRGAFKISKLKVKHVAVIDDVMTTGTTMREFCATLTHAGIERIDVWCVARTNLG